MRTGTQTRSTRGNSGMATAGLTGMEKLKGDERRALTNAIKGLQFSLWLQLDHFVRLAQVNGINLTKLAPGIEDYLQAANIPVPVPGTASNGGEEAE